jgi:hypothetical protein
VREQQSRRRSQRDTAGSPTSCLTARGRRQVACTTVLDWSATPHAAGPLLFCGPSAAARAHPRIAPIMTVPPRPAIRRAFLLPEDPITIYSPWRDEPAATWRWPNFSPAEIACRGSGRLLLNEAALDKLQALRSRLGKPLILRSAPALGLPEPRAYRAIEGVTASKHLEGIVFDAAMANHDLESVRCAARGSRFQRFGFHTAVGLSAVS